MRTRSERTVAEVTADGVRSLADEIDILAKAKRALGAGLCAQRRRRRTCARRSRIISACCCSNGSARSSPRRPATLQSLQDGPIREPDLNDRASSETDWGIELRTRDRQRKLIAKIDSALRRIDEGEYGYCEVTGEPIGLGG